MSDVNSLQTEIQSPDINALLGEFELLINSERNIAEINPEVNALSEQIEHFFKAQKKSPELSENSENQLSTGDNQNISESTNESTDEPENQSHDVAQQQLSKAHQKWDILSRNFRKKRRKYYEERNQDRQKNLEKRMTLIESFKGLLSQEENISQTLKSFKALQNEWYTVGPIPQNDYEMVWQTYRHHVEKFYDYLNLNREFRDLDFKYNYDQKLRIIAQAQKLTTLDDQNIAFKELQKLHKIWKEDIGPVAKEHREPLWQTFSKVTKIIHDKRQAFFKDREERQQENLTRKKAIVVEILAITGQNHTNHKTWQKSITIVQKLRDEFFDLGPVPKKGNKSLWADFKEATKAFNQAKNAFFKQQKKQLMANLRAKKELIAIAEQHLAAKNFEESTPIMKKIQADWRNIGPVPHRDSDKIWNRFKTACNSYFKLLQNDQKVDNETRQMALTKKTALLKTLNDKPSAHFKDIDEIRDLVNQWTTAGTIPAKHKGLDEDFFKGITTRLIELGQTEFAAALSSFSLKIEGYVAQDQEELLKQQGQLVQQKIKDLKTEIMQLENNLGFFQNAGENNPLLKEVHDNISKHRDALELWQEKKQILRRL